MNWGGSDRFLTAGTLVGILLALPVGLVAQRPAASATVGGSPRDPRDPRSRPPARSLRHGVSGDARARGRNARRDARLDVGRRAVPAHRPRAGGRRRHLVPVVQHHPHAGLGDLEPRDDRRSAAGAVRRHHPAGVGAGGGDGPVLWLADPTDTTADVRGRIVATLLRAPAPERHPSDQLSVSASATRTPPSPALSRASPGAVPPPCCSSPDAPVDSAFEAVAVMRQRATTTWIARRRASAGQSDRVPPPRPSAAGPTPAFLVRAAMARDAAAGPRGTLAIRLERFETPR